MSYRNIAVFLVIVFSVVYYDSRCIAQNSQQDFEQYKQAAENGDTNAQFKIGEMYAEGKGVFQDYRQSVKWLTKAAEQGHAEAQVILGTMYFKGLGVEQNFQKAFEWCEKSAKQSYPPAQSSLGRMYAEGKVVTQDYKQAVEWFAKAAEQGHPEGQDLLGGMYFKGLGIKQNFQESFKWCEKSAKQGFPPAQFHLGEIYAGGKAVTDVELSEFRANELAVKWFTKSAEQGYVEAQVALGVMYFKGSGVIQNTQTAIMWYTKAAERGFPPAQFHLGMMYIEGKTALGNNSFELAAEWLTKAAEQSFPPAQLYLGMMYAKGDGVTKDYVEAYKWAILAAYNGDKKAVQFRNKLKQDIPSVQIAKAKKLAKAFELSRKKTIEYNKNVQNTYSSEEMLNSSHPPSKLSALSLPENGEVIRYHTSKAIAPFEIKTQLGKRHYFVKLVEYGQKKTILTVFIRDGQSVKIDVPLGTYEVKYAVGQTWYGPENLFGPDTKYSKADEKFEFKKIGNQVKGYTIELYLQVDGNLETESISHSEF